MIYNLPEFKESNSFVKTLLGGWEAAAIVQISSGTSLTPQLNATGISNFNVDGNLVKAFQAGITGTGTGVANQRPLRVDGVPCTIDGEKGSFINPDAFTLVGYEIGQTIPRKTTCSGPATKNVDLSFYKNFSPAWLTKSFFGETSRIQFRIEPVCN